jgi:hypothetical protein
MYEGILGPALWALVGFVIGYLAARWRSHHARGREFADLYLQGEKKFQKGLDCPPRSRPMGFRRKE